MYSDLRYSLNVILVLAVTASISRAPWMIPQAGAASSAFTSPVDADRAKTGPSVVPIENRLPQELNDKAFAAGGGNQAERGRFELPLPFQADRFSKPAHSTTLPPLREWVGIVSLNENSVKFP